MLFLGPIRRSVRSNLDPHYLTTFCGTVLQQQSIDVNVFFFKKFPVVTCLRKVILQLYVSKRSLLCYFLSIP